MEETIVYLSYSPNFRTWPYQFLFHGTIPYYLTTTSWLIHLWSLLHKSNFLIIFGKTVNLTEQCVGDTMIMINADPNLWTHTEIQVINQCLIRINSITLRDITSQDVTYNIPFYLDSTTKCKSIYQWTQWEIPTKKIWMERITIIHIHTV